MKRSTLAFLLAASLPLGANAQRYLGLSTGNYSSTNSVYLNPANIADSRHKFTIDLFSLNFGVDNNLGTINSGEIFGGLGTDSIGSILNINNQGKFKMMLPYAELRGPGFMVSINNKHAVGLTTRVRTFNQLNDFDQNIFKVIQGSAGTDFISRGNQFDYTLHTWAEIGATYGGVIYEKEKHQVKVGATVRYLHGGGYVNARSNNLDMSYNTGTDLVTVNNTDLNFSTTYYSNDANSGVGDNLRQALKGLGAGVGADLGVTYEFRPQYQKHTYEMDGKTDNYDRSVPTYMLRFSAAVTDIGAITYKKQNSALSLTSGGNNVTFNGDELADSVSDYNSLRRFAANKGITVDSTNSVRTVVGMPTALVLGVDYNIANLKGVYANLTYMGNIASTANPGNSIYSQITLTPRYENRTIAVGIPVTYNFVNSSIKAGIGVRVGGFFFGSDDMLAFMSNKQYGANFYFGAFVPFNKKKPKDSDGDLVSNKKDKCPNEKGVLEMEGCPNPDKDGDGILDKDDKCPEIAGSKTAMGCPDSDLDSLADSEDRCPTEAGSVAMQGCPDRDGDSVVDLDDTCPDVPGLAAFQGCPDTDGDGLPDNEDSCPEKPGPMANGGCPDTDNDGIADHLDKCPLVPGTPANNGCPEVSVEVKKRLAFAATALQFETGKAVIKKASFSLLDEIVQILNDYPDYYMTIDGHTDAVGNDDKNMVLSLDRANSVKNYFIAKGIAEDRLKTNGYGETQPVADNKTSAGRAKNRRVDMDLKLKD